MGDELNEEARRASLALRQQTNFKILTKYIPKVVLNHYKTKYLDKESQLIGTSVKDSGVVFSKSMREGGVEFPDSYDHDCVSMFIDVARFTQTTADLDEYSDGSGQLATALNDLMSFVVREIKSVNGDIIKFAGDAILIVWPVSSESEDTSLESLLETAIRLAFKLVTEPEGDYFYMKDPDDHDAPDHQESMKKILEVKIGVSFGKMKILHLGGSPDNVAKNRMEYLAVGPALNEAFEAEGKCGPSSIVVPSKVQEIPVIQQNCTFEPLLREKAKSLRKSLPGNSRLIRGKSPRKKRVRSKENLMRPRGSSFLPIFGRNTRIFSSYVDSYEASGSVVEIDEECTHFAVTGVVLKRQRKARDKNVGLEQVVSNFGRILFNFVPVSIMPYLYSQGNELDLMLPEMREVTTIFLKLDVVSLGIHKYYLNDALFKQENEEESKRVLEKVQLAFRTVQEVVFRYHGIINKFLVDDKGCSVLIAFGLPPFAHENDPDRALICGFGMMAALGDKNVQAHCGITSGKVFCGAIGKISDRVEYTIIGDRVNVAARLMVAAVERKKEMIIDAETKSGLVEDIPSERVEELKLKGKGLYLAYAIRVKDQISEFKSKKSSFQMDLRSMSRSTFRSSLVNFTLHAQIEFGKAEKLILDTTTGENVKAKVAKTRVGSEYVQKLFDTRLNQEISQVTAERCEILFAKDRPPLELELSLFDGDSLKVCDIKKEAIFQLSRFGWPQVFDDPSKLSSRQGTAKVELKKPNISTAEEEENLVSLCSKYSLFWRPDSIDGESEYLELNDVFDLRRMTVPVTKLTFKLKRTAQLHWKMREKKRTTFEKVRYERLTDVNSHTSKFDHSTAVNAFSIHDKLNEEANLFYVGVEASSAVKITPSKTRIVVIEASSGVGKTHAVNNLISTILQTSNYEVLFAGGDPYEEGVEADVFSCASIVLNQILRLRMDQGNVRNKGITDDLKSVSFDAKKETSLPNMTGEVLLKHKVLKRALERAKVIFKASRVPKEGKDKEEKSLHMFDETQLFLLNDIFGTDFVDGSLKREPKKLGKLANMSIRNRPEVTQDTMAMLMTNYSVGTEFKSAKINRLSFNLLKNNRKSYMGLTPVIRKPPLPLKFQEQEIEDDNVSTSSEDTLSLVSPEYLGQEDDASSTASIELRKLDTLASIQKGGTQSPRESRVQGFLSHTGVPTSVLNMNQKPVSKISQDDPGSFERSKNIREKAKLMAAIVAGLAAETAPLLVSIDNAQLVDPMSLFVVQELTQWWSAAHVMILISTRMAFSDDVGTSNVQNLKNAARERMSVVPGGSNTDYGSSVGTFSSTAVGTESSATRTSSIILLEQLKELRKVVNISLLPDKNYTKEIIECCLVHKGRYSLPKTDVEFVINQTLLEYLIERATGNFQYITEALEMYLEKSLIEVVGSELRLTQLGASSFGVTFESFSSKKHSKKRGMAMINFSKSSIQHEETPEVIIDSLVPRSLHASFGEYVDSLELPQQILLKCAAVDASTNKSINRGQFRKSTVIKICSSIFKRQRALIEQAFSVLEKTQLIMPVVPNVQVNRKANPDIMFKFKSEWYLQILKGRLLAKQRDRIARMIDKIRRAVVDDYALKHLQDSEMRGKLQVKKLSKKNGVKKRFCVLKDGEFSLYYADPEKKSSNKNLRTVIYLKNASTRSKMAKKGSGGAFSIITKRFYEQKHQQEVCKETEFIFMTDSVALAKQWVSKIRIQIGKANQSLSKDLLSRDDYEALI